MFIIINKVILYYRYLVATAAGVGAAPAKGGIKVPNEFAAAAPHRLQLCAT